MAKKGPIGKVEQFYIESKINEKTTKEIAIDLDRSISSVEKFMKKHKIESKPKRSHVSDQFARSSGTVAMTENASSMSEQTRKRVNKLDRSCTTKIK